MMRTLAYQLAAGAVLVASSCGPAAAPPTPVASRPPALTHVIVAYSNISATIMPLWVAKQTGLFEKHGLDLDLQYAASATSVAAVVSGQMQLATVGLSEVLGAIAGGADLVVLATQVPAYTYIFEVAPGIQSAADLKGKAIGISRTGSSSDIGTRVVLSKFGLDPDKDVNLVQTGSVSDRAAAMRSGALQAAVASPPETLAVERLGWHPLFDLAALQLPAVTLGLVVQRSYRDANQAIVQAYVDALLEGIARVRSDRTLALELLKSNMNIDAEEDLNVTYDYFTRPELMPSLPYPRPEQFTDTLAILGKTNERLAKLDVAPLLDTCSCDSWVILWLENMEVVWSTTVAPSGSKTSTDAHRVSATSKTCLSGNSASVRSSFNSANATFKWSSGGTVSRPERLMLPKTVVIDGGSGGAASGS